MLSRATEWHRKRTRLLVNNGLGAEFSHATGLTKASLILFPLLHLAACVACKYLSLLEILVMAYTLGSFCVMYIFSNAHEIFHGMISPRFQAPAFRNLFLRLATLSDISPGLYLYYKYGHGPHHSVQGSHKLDAIKARLFEENMDVDPITNFKNLYKFSRMDNGPLAYRFPAIERNRWARLGALFFLPLIDTLIEIVCEPFRFMVLHAKARSAKAKRTIRDVAFQHFLMLAFQISLAWIIQDLSFLLYLFLSRAFFLGFLHPYGLMWVAIHKSKDEPGAYQPATSIRSPFATWLCAGINLHLEHHDAPWVSRGRLAKVVAAAPELYRGTHAFAGFRDVWRFVMQPVYSNVYCP